MSVYETHLNLLNHARKCAVDACANGLWNSFELNNDPREWVKDGPRIEDAQSLIKEYGRKTGKEMNFWKAAWKAACIHWFYQLHDYNKICGLCGKTLNGEDLLNLHGFCTKCFEALEDETSFRARK